MRVRLARLGVEKQPHRVREDGDDDDVRKRKSVTDNERTGREVRVQGLEGVEAIGADVFEDAAIERLKIIFN